MYCLIHLWSASFRMTWSRNCRGAHCASVVILNNQDQADMVRHDYIFVDCYGFINMRDVLYRIFYGLTDNT